MCPTPRGGGGANAWDLPGGVGWRPPTHLTTCSSLLACSSACSASVTSWGQTGVRLAHPRCPAHCPPTSPQATHLPEDDARVAGASEGMVIQPAAVQPPDLVLVGVQRPHTLIVLDGPELHEPIRAAGFRIGRGLSPRACPQLTPNPAPPSPTHLDSSCVPRLTKATFSTEASCPSNVCRVRRGEV